MSEKETSNLNNREIKILGILWVGFALLGWVTALSEYAFGIDECLAFFDVGLYLFTLSCPISFFITKTFSFIEKSLNKRKIEPTISSREKKMFWRIVGAIFVVATAITIYGIYIYSTTAKFAQAWITGGYWTWVQVTPPDSTFFIVGVALYPISVIIAEIIMLAVSLIRAKRRQNKKGGEIKQ
jgi:hypothetical protein